MVYERPQGKGKFYFNSISHFRLLMELFKHSMVLPHLSFGGCSFSQVTMDFCILYWLFQHLSIFSNSIPTYLALEATLQTEQVMGIVNFHTESHDISSYWLCIHHLCRIFELDPNYLDQPVPKSCIVVPIPPKASQYEI